MTKKNAIGGEKQNKKSKAEQSDLCNPEQLTLEPQVQTHHCLNIWPQVWCHSADLEEQNCLFRRNGKINFSRTKDGAFLLVDSRIHDDMAYL